MSTLPTSTQPFPDVDVHFYPWHLDTKYYTADISLCTAETRTIGNEVFAESVNAVVLVFDTALVSCILCDPIMR